MSGFSTNAATAIIEHFFKGNPQPARAAYLALFTEDPTDAADVSKEISAAWYVRKPIQLGVVRTESGKEEVENTAAILFPVVSGSPVTIKAWDIFDAATGGNMTGSGLFPSEATLPVGFSFLADAGDIKASFY